MPRIFEYPVAVGPESIDILGHANNREYLRWMEEAAIAHSTARGWPMERYVGARAGLGRRHAFPRIPAARGGR
ncbi:MAG: acyl-CoA thioesterase [Betaproteobacteria bacterium]|jgi:acyl-CoA thioester hydrolase